MDVLVWSSRFLPEVVTGVSKQREQTVESACRERGPCVLFVVEYFYT